MTSKRPAAFLAAIMMGCAAIGHDPVCRQKADAKTPTVKDFADSVLPLLPVQSDTVFDSLCYSKKQKTLLRDGETVSRDSFAGFRVINGELKIAASETVRAGETASQEYLSLEEAAPLIGLETRETADGIYVSDPFRSGTLIVKSETLPDTKGADEIGCGWNDLHVLQYPTAADAYAACLEYRSDDTVTFAEPNRIVHIADAEYERTDTEEAADSYAFPADNWGWEAVGADSFLTQHQADAGSAPEIVVAVIDTGLYSGHNWFRNRIAEGGASFIPENRASYEDPHGHGTHCAGIICGMTPENVKIMPLKVLSEQGYGEALGIYCAMLYAAEQDVDVVSMSLGGEGCTPMFEEAVRALKEKEIPCVAAAGNSSTEAKYFSPANIPDVFTVSSLSRPVLNYAKMIYGKEYYLSSFSNYGTRIDFAAPGDDILSASLESPNSTIEMSGTSMACPHAAGCVADILTLHPDYTISEVYDCLKGNADDLGEPGFDSSFGWGLVNVAALDDTQSSLERPQASCGSGMFDSVFTVTLSTPETDAEIRYTLDGTTPDAETGILYQGEEILIDQTMTLSAVTVKDGECSHCARWHYDFTQEPPFIDPESDEYFGDVTIEIETAGSGDVYYTLDGSDPSPENGILYTRPFNLTETALLKASVVIGRYVSEPCIRYYVIDGEKADDLIFETENGVLTHYYGFYEDLDLNDYFAPGELTAIGENAFRFEDDPEHHVMDTMQSIILPESVTTIGAYAFCNCKNLCSVTAPGVVRIDPHAFDSCLFLSSVYMPALKTVGAYAFTTAFDRNLPEFPFGADNQIEELGDYAFNGSFLTSAVLPNLKVMGENVFSYNYDLKSVSLSASITVLPAKTFFASDSLASLDAPGVTVLGDQSIDMGDGDCPTLLNCSIDFSKVTSIGSEALRTFKKPMGRVSFDALTEIKYNTFADFPADVICLPALREIPAGAFRDATCSAVYLEQAEKLEPGALTPNPYWQRHIVFVLGDQVSRNQENPLETGCTGITIAAPAGSVMQQFALAAQTEYCSTPDLYIPAGFGTCRQYDTVSLDACIPLGFGCRTEWTVQETAYDTGYQAPEQPLYADESGEKRFLDTRVPGKVTLQADLLDGSDTVLTSKTVEISIAPADDTEIITNEGVVFWDWKQGNVYKSAPEVDSIFVGPDILASYRFLFSPEEDGEYYFMPENGSVSVSVYNDRNELIGFTNDCVYLGDLDPDPVTLKAGERYCIQSETRYVEPVNNQYAGLLISRQKPSQLIEFQAQIHLEQSMFEKGTDIPDIPALVSVTTYNYDWYAEEIPTLKQNVDYQLFYQQTGDFGSVYAVGMGDYIGMLDAKIYFYEEYRIGKTRELPELCSNQQVCYHVKYDGSDDQTIIGLRLSDAYTQTITSGELTDNLSDGLMSMTVYDSEMSIVSSSLSNYYMYPENVYTLQNDQDYYITLSYYQDNQSLVDTIAPAGKFTLFSGKYEFEHWLLNCEIQASDSSFYTGSPQKVVQSVTDPNGKKLEQGKDYEVYMVNNAIPGQEEYILTGIGDYYGTLTLVYEITESYISDGPLAPETIRLNEPFTVRNACGFFELETDSSYACRLHNTAAGTPFIYCVFRYDEELLTWTELYSRTCVKEEAELDLEAGRYHIYLAQDTEDQAYILEAEETQIHISKAAAQAETLVFTGKECIPEITLTYDGNTLTEGEDYMLIYPDKPIIECGIYEMSAAGLGRFSGVRTIPVIVKAQESELLPEAKTGDNTLTVTAPGETAFCEWIPEDANYGIRMNELMIASLVICDTETNAEVVKLKGNGYLYDFFDVTPGRKYRIYASWLSPEQTGDIDFALLSDYTDLSTCTAEGETQILFTGADALPAFTVRDGETILQKGTDYSIYYSGGYYEPGHAFAALTGTGAYIGRLNYHYYLCPDTQTDPAMTETLTLDSDPFRFTLMPGDIQEFIFDAPADGCYRIIRPDPEYSGVCVFAFAPDGTLLPFGSDSVEMKANERLRLLAVSDHLDDYHRIHTEYELAVYDDSQTAELRIDDCVYQIRNGFAYLDQYEGENIGIQLPAAVYDPESDTEIPVKGYTPNLLNTVGTSKTLYCDNDPETLMQMSEAGVCFAVTDPQTGIKGDITGDGNVYINDWLTLMRCITECPGMVLSDAAFAAADMNGDGILDLADADALRSAFTWNISPA